GGWAECVKSEVAHLIEDLLGRDGTDGGGRLLLADPQRVADEHRAEDAGDADRVDWTELAALDAALDDARHEGAHRDHDLLEVERPLRDAGAARDVVEARAAEPFLVEDVERGIEDLLRARVGCASADGILGERERRSHGSDN